MHDLDRVAVILFAGKPAGCYSASIAAEVHGDGGVEVLGITLPLALPADDVAALRAGQGKGANDG